MKINKMIFVGIIIFMFASCIESTWIINYLSSHEIETAQANLMVTIYGIGVLISSFYSGLFYEKFGIKHTIRLSFYALLIGTFLLIVSFNYMSGGILPILGYLIRSFSYPLFAYSLFSFLMKTTSHSIIGKITGYFWLSFNLGFTILGPFVSVRLLRFFSMDALLMMSIMIGYLGYLVVQFSIKEELEEEKHPKQKIILNELVQNSIGYLLKNSAIQSAVFFKSINNIGQFGLVLIMPKLLAEIGFSQEFWSNLWSFSYVVNIIAGVAIGEIADRMGLLKTFKFFSGLVAGCGLIIVYLLLLFEVHEGLYLFGALSIYTIGIAGYGPLAGIIKDVIPETGIAISLLNLGSGFSNLLGPLLVSLFLPIFDNKTVILIFGLVYIISMIFADHLNNKRST